ncbi:MarC family protein [Nitratiruptor sp. SB155-2]|uniref:MarC family protein n=1 Tax=Nitratiruptor sp. (strain SB155-2) TaxID=387092 RepID=UPI0001586E87|nr:MarC family protein [Nitratiruptor sp. SB155-2]BAF69189.1 multiple antibiotic transporter, MarC family [Nitratiruptor sp. SB155-2]
MNSIFISILLHDIIALITIINPIAAASIMISMISPPTASAIADVARKATLTVFAASFVTLFGGEVVFQFFGINIYSIKIIGGIILMLIAINMAYGHGAKNRHSPEEAQEAQEKEDIAIVPLGIPILFGPGVIATIVVLSHNNSSQLHPALSYILLSIAILIASLATYLTLRYASIINKALGVTGIKILTRIMGLIVGAIAAQFLISGIKGLWEA